MTNYLVTEVLHRLDGTSVAHCVMPDSYRKINLRFTLHSKLPPILPGRAYDFGWKYHNGTKNITDAIPVQIQIGFWSNFISKGFYVPGLYFPEKVKANLLALQPKFISELLSNFHFGDYKSLNIALHEPYSSAVICHYNKIDRCMDALSEMMQLGLSQVTAEQIYLLHGSSYKIALRSPEQLFGFLLPDALKTSPEYRLIKFLHEKADRGVTLVHRNAVPHNLHHAINICHKSKIIVVGNDRIQLSIHAIQQRRLRNELQRIVCGFTPTYSEAEIRYAYSRYLGFLGIFDNQTFQSTIITALNSRFSYMDCSSAQQASQYFDEFSSILQLLGNTPPYLIVRNQRELDHFSTKKTEVVPIIISTLNTSNTAHKTVIIVNFHHYSIIDAFQLFSKLTEKDRIIAFSDLSRSTESYPGTMMAKQLASYFPYENILREEPAPSAYITEPCTFNALDIKIRLQRTPNSIALCDSHEVAFEINQLLADTSQPTILIKGNKVYKKNDRVIILNTGTDRKSPTLCRLLSANDRGISVASATGYIRIAASLLDVSVVSHAYAITVEMAIDLQIPEAILVSSEANAPKLSALLADHSIKVIRKYVYSAADFPDSDIPAIQRITPMVE